MCEYGQPMRQPVGGNNEDTKKSGFYRPDVHRSGWSRIGQGSEKSILILHGIDPAATAHRLPLDYTSSAPMMDLSRPRRFPASAVSAALPQ